MRVPNSLTKGGTAPPDPFSPHDLRFSEFSLLPDMDCEPTLNKPIAFGVFYAQPLFPKTDPGGNFVRNLAKRYDVMAWATIARNKLPNSTVQVKRSLRVGC